MRYKQYLLLSLCVYPLYSVSSFQLGLENLSPKIVQSYHLDTNRVGLITNQTGVNQSGMSTIDHLRQKRVNVTTIFAPEHGYDGKTPAGLPVDNKKDQKTGIPIVSLYSAQKGLVGKTINEEKIHNVDLLIFDMQDSGMRHYTYISTLMKCLEGAATFNKPVFVLDRPNPLGHTMEGPLVEDHLLSFISIAPIPLRHGMTIGEIAWYFNKHILKKPADLHIVTMTNYDRTMNVTQILSQPLSPNIPTAHACFGYSFLGLLGEVQPFDVGVGTAHPFQCIMLPKALHVKPITWCKAQRILADYGIISKKQSYFNARKKQDVEGLHLTIPTPHKVKTLPLFLRLVSLFKHNGIPISYAPTFDKAIGNSIVKQALCNNQTDLNSIKQYCDKHLKQFYRQAQTSFLYKPYPLISHGH